MTYRPTRRKQGDGTPCQWANCNPTSHAMASDRHRRGVDPNRSSGWLPMPAEIRRRIGGCSGTSLADNAAAVLSLYGVAMLPRYNLPWDTFRSLIQSGRGAVVSIRYSVIAPTIFDGSPGFVGGHAIYVNERRSSDGRFLVYDPLADGRRSGIPLAPDWWPATLLKNAAGAYTGAGLVDASFTRDTEV